VPPVMKPGRHSALHPWFRFMVPPAVLHPFSSGYAEFGGGAGRSLTAQVGGGGSAGADNTQQATR
jgi:hypothetical protein